MDKPATTINSTSRSGMEAVDEEEFIVPLCSVFRRHLKSEKQRFTPERAQVLDAIIQLDRIFEADELFLEVRNRGMRVSKATIYRTSKLLVDAGIIEQVPLDQKQAHYRLTYGRPPQGQLICVDTGKTIDFTLPELINLRDRIAGQYGWTPIGHRLQIAQPRREREVVDLAVGEAVAARRGAAHVHRGCCARDFRS